MMQMRLRSSLTLLLVLTVSLIFSLVGGGILLLRLPQVEARTRATLQDRAEGASRLLDHFSRAVEAQLNSYCLAVESDPAERLTALANHVAQGGELFEAIYVLSPSGRVQALGLPKRNGAAAAEMLGLDLSNNGLVGALRAQAAESTAPVLWSDEYLSVLAGRNTVALGRRVGERIVIFEMSADRLLNMLKDSSADASYNIVVVDQRGRYLASSFLRNPDARFADYRQSPSFRAIMTGTPLPGSELAADGRRMLVGGVRSDKLGWVIGAVSEGGLGEYSYRSTVLLVAGGFMVSLLFAALIAPLWAARLARPLNAVIARTHRVTEGDFESPWPKHSGVQELNQLAGDVEKMVATVQSRELETKRNAERLRATLESTPSLAVQWYDIGGKVLYWNAASEGMYGLSAAGALGRTAGDAGLMFLDDAQVRSFLDILAEIDRTGAPFGPAEFVLRHANGSLLTVLATLFAIPSDDGGKTFVCMDIDVTERKRTESALAHSEQKLEAIFNASPAALSVSDATQDHCIISVNAAWERLFKRQASAVMGKNGSHIGLWRHSSDRETFFAQLSAGQAVNTMEVELCDGRGDVLLCQLSAVIVELADERLLLMAAEDVTEQRRAEDALRALNTELEQRVARRTEELSRANGRLEKNLQNLRQAQEQLVQSEKLAALGQLVAGVAHELNTPVGNAMLAMSTLRDHLSQFRASLSGPLKRSVLDDFMRTVEQGSNIALRNMTRAGELVTSFKQVAIDQTTMQRRSFQVAEVVDEILLTLNPMIRRTPYRIEKELAAGLTLDSYPGPLGQVLTNLINNAVTHGFDGREHGLIRVVSEPGDKGLKIRVIDDGGGIPADMIGRVFDPFFTTRMGRGGTGLGLHIVHTLVTQVLGGRIEVRSTLGVGSEFMLELPLIAPVADAPAEALA